jgi:hypothetical protein
VTSASERSRTDLATVRSPHLPGAAPKGARALLTSKDTRNWTQSVGPADISLIAGGWVGMSVP